MEEETLKKWDFGRTFVYMGLRMNSLLFIEIMKKQYGTLESL
jgi:hypothetical protein